MDTGNYVFLVICYISTIITGLILFLRNYLFWDILHYCHEIDRILEQFGIATHHQKHFISYLKLIVLQAISFTIINVISIHIYHGSLLQNQIPFGNMGIMFAIFTLALSVVIIRFESTNLCLM